MDFDHDPDRVTLPTEGEKADQVDLVDPWTRMQEAAQQLAQAARDLPAMPPIVIPPLRLPRLQLAYDEGDTPRQAADPRHVIVSVLTVKLQRHDFSDSEGLGWQTYGPDDRNFTTERLLEIHNSDSEVIASYPAGTWLDVCYPAYRRPSELKDLS